MASRNAIIGVAAAIAVAGGVGYAMMHGGPDTPKVATPTPRPLVTAQPVPLNDEERKAYVKEHVVIEGLTVEADTKPGTNEEVPGLLRASGTVINKGDRAVTPITLVLHLTGKDDEDVLGSYLEDVSGMKPLAAGASRAFKFTLPDKKAWGGKFKQALQ